MIWSAGAPGSPLTYMMKAGKHLKVKAFFAIIRSVRKIEKIYKTDRTVPKFLIWVGFLEYSVRFNLEINKIEIFSSIRF